MSLAKEAREAVRRSPFLRSALRAGVVNYTAAARYLDVGGDEEAVATALRRYAEDLPDPASTRREARITMESGVGPAGTDEEALLSVGDAGLAPAAGDRTAVLATGEVDAAALSWVLQRLLAVDVDVDAAGVAGDALLVVVGRRDGADALRVVEDALATVPDPGGEQ